MNINTIIWDLGNVLIKWDPRRVFTPIFNDLEKEEYFFSQICTDEWNEEQDAGRTIEEGTKMLVEKHPEWKDHIKTYYGRWEEMLGGPIEGTVEIFKELKESNKYNHYALTNWSAELFPIALRKYEFLHWFDGRIVSGEEKMRKPFPEFYQLLLNRFHVIKKECIFIDDNLRNIKAAKELGIYSIAFKDPEQLRTELKELQVL